MNFDSMPQAYPAIYSWATYALTNFIKRIYLCERERMKTQNMVNAQNVELCAVLERALNYMHTGNVKVIATSVMNPMWIGQALLEDGLPCLNPSIVRFFSQTWELSAMEMKPTYSAGVPNTAAKRVILYNYNATVYNVSIFRLLFKKF
jgi:hypothetical protein